MIGWMVLINDLTAVCRNLLQAGMGLALQSTLLLSAGLLAGRQLRRHGPAVSALVYKATVLATVLGPLLAGSIGGRFQPLWTIALPPAQEAENGAPLPDLAAAQSARMASAPRPILAGGPGLGIPQTHRSALLTHAAEQSASLPTGNRTAWKSAPVLSLSPPLLPVRTTPIGWLYLLLAGIWGGGVTVLLTRLARCCRWMRHLRKASMPAGGDAQEMLEQISRTRRLNPAPRLRVSAQVQSPVLTGVRHPAILLPASSEQQFDGPALRAVLSHELAHLEHGDCAWLLLVRLACAVGWVQPLWWVLARALEASSEEVCDQEVLRRDASPHTYARCLVDLAERMILSRVERATGAGMAPSRSSLERRVRSILSGPQRPSSPLTSPMRVAITLGTLAALGAGLLLISVAAAPADLPLKDPLADDSRLAQKVKVTVEGLPVSDLLAQLSAKTGVSLAADADTGDDKVIAFGPGRPLRELLADLAALFNDRWEKTRAASGVVRYRLIRTVSARQLEAAYARRATDEQMRLLGQSVRALDMKPEELARPGNEYIQDIVSDRKRRFAIRLYRLLSQAQREALFQSESLRISFRALTPEQQAPIRAIFADVIAQEKAFSEEKAKQLPPELGLSPSLVSRAEDLESGEIRFKLGHTGGMTFVDLQFGNRYSEGINFGGFGTGNQWSLPARGNPYTGEPVSTDAPLPERRVTHTAAAQKAWPDRLRQLAEGSGLTVIADYYRVRPVTAFYIPLRPGAPEDTAIALDDLCGQSGYLWWMRGRSLMLRKRDWFHQNRYEVPDRWVLEMVQRTQRGPLTCANVSRVLDLTDDQILGLKLLSDRELGEDGQYAIFNRAEQIGGLREYLSIVNAAPRKADGRIENEQTVSRDGTTGEEFMAKYDTMTPFQQRLVPGFLTAQDYPLSSTDPEQFGLNLIPIGSTPDTTPSGYKHVPFRLAWDMAGTEKISLGWVIDLPASLPDDRRDRTRIDLLP